MDIKSLHIEGFGAFSDFSAGPLPRGLVIILGRNEAGKSTLLSFVNAMFFGFPDARRNEKQFHPVHGGRYGGRITLSTGRFGQVTLERIKAGAGRLCLYGPDGTRLDNSVLKGMFGGVTRRLYQNVYSFSLQELQSFESLRREDIRSAIYGAGFGTAFLAVPETERKLRKEMSDIFRPAGRKQPVNRLLSKIRIANEELGRIRGEIDHYHRLNSAIDAMDRELEGLRKEREDARTSLNRCRAAAGSMDDWARLRVFQARLSEIEEDERIERLSHDLFRQLGQNEAETAEMKERLRKLRRDMEEQELRMVLSRPDGAFIEKKDAVSALLPTRDKYLQLQDLRKDRLKDIQEIRGILAAVLDGLGGKWTVDRIRETVFSVADRREARRFQKQMEEAEKERQRLEDRLEIRLGDLSGLRKQIRELDEEISRIEARTAGIDLASLPERAEQAARLQKTAVELEEKEQKQESLCRRIKEGMAEISPALSFEVLKSMDPGRLMKKAARIREELEENRGRARECRLVLTGLYDRDEELSRQIENRKKRFSELELPGMLRGLEESLSRISFLARSVSQAAGQQANMEGEILRLQEKRYSCSTRVDLLSAEKKRIKACRWPHMLTASGLFLLMVSAFLLYLDKSSALWGSAAASAVIMLCAGPGLGRKYAGRRKALDVEIRALLEEKAGVEQQKKRIGLSLERIRSERKKLSELLDIDEGAVSRDFVSLLRDIEDAGRVLDKRNLLLSEISGLKDDRKLVAERMRNAEKKASELREERKSLESRWAGFVSENCPGSGCRPEDIPLLARKVQKPKELLEHMELLQKELKVLEEEKARLLEMLYEIGLGADSDAGAAEFAEKLGKILLKINDLERDAEALRMLGSRLDQMRREAGTLEEETGGIREKMETCSRQLEMISESWSRWLHQKGMDRDLDPAGVLETADLVAGARQQLSRKYVSGKELRGINREISRISARVSPLFEELMPGRQDVSDVPSRIDMLSQRLSEELERDIKSRLLGQKMQQMKKEEAGLSERVTRVREETEKLLKQAGCGSSEEFRALYVLFQEREEILLERAGLVAALTAVTGAEDIESISEFFGVRSHVELTREQEALSDRLSRIESKIERVVDKRARAGRELEELTSSDEHMALLAKRSQLIQEVRELARRWSVLSLALHMLEQAKERFEKENQPRVIKAASGFFSSITMGRYSGIAASGGTDDIQAVTRDGRRLDTENLSRGTAEQLYLCLRFGVIAASEAGSEKLPVLMDDILVNFDPERTRQAARALGRLSQERQLLFFTCHPHVATLLNEEVPEAALIELD